LDLWHTQQDSNLRPSDSESVYKAERTGIIFELESTEFDGWYVGEIFTVS